MDLEKFNADWLQAWTDKDVDAVMGFYAPDATFNDAQTAKGIKGHDQIRAYFEQVFSSTPPMAYIPEKIWLTDEGYCGRWYGHVGEDGTDAKIRGFDLCIIKDGLIAHNEVYIHIVEAKQA